MHIHILYGNISSTDPGWELFCVEGKLCGLKSKPNNAAAPQCDYY